ncbi:hypothetical protein JW948_17130 [bacterium]|nr:hypothetical protein [bacterium]
MKDTPEPFKDRRGTLAFFGVVMIFMGAGSLLLIPLMLLSMAAGMLTGEGGQPAAAMVPSILFYFVLGGVFIGLGVGSAMKKRWARALILVLHWIWLATGVFSTLFMAVIFRDIIRIMVGEIQDPVLMGLMYAIVILTTGLIFIVHPLIFIVIYRNPNVKATFEYYDPDERWTDRKPLPVLAVCFMQVYGAVSLMSGAMYHWTVPFFGTLLYGLAGALVTTLLLIVQVFLIRELYRQSLRAWWVLVGLILTGSVSFVMTFMKHDFLEIYRFMNYSEEQMAMLHSMGSFWNRDFPVYILIVSLCYILFLFYIKNYFSEKQETAHG